MTGGAMPAGVRRARRKRFDGILAAVWKRSDVLTEAIDATASHPPPARGAPAPARCRSTWTPPAPLLPDARRGVQTVVAVTYEDLPDGAALRYATGDPELVAALHDWFDAQVRDHGQHAGHAEHPDDG